MNRRKLMQAALALGAGRADGLIAARWKLGSAADVRAVIAAATPS